MALNPAERNSNGSVLFANNTPMLGGGIDVGGETCVHPNLSIYGHYALLLLGGTDEVPYVAENLGSARHKITAGARLTLPSAWFVTLDGQWVSATEMDRVPALPSSSQPFQSFRLDDFAMVHSRIGYILSDDFEFSVAINNLLNDTSAQFPGGDVPERRVFATLSYAQ